MAGMNLGTGTSKGRSIQGTHYITFKSNDTYPQERLEKDWGTVCKALGTHSNALLRQRLVFLCEYLKSKGFNYDNSSNFDIVEIEKEEEPEEVSKKVKKGKK